MCCGILYVSEKEKALKKFILNAFVLNGAPQEIRTPPRLGGEKPEIFFS
jgi:hypothetical protein